MKNKINDPIRRTQAYWYIDGLWEIGFGSLFFILGVVLILETRLVDQSAATSTLRTLRNILLIGGSIGMGLAVRWIKTNLTYPRTGYLAYQQPRGRQLVKTLALGIGIVALAGLVIVLAFWLIPAMQEILVHLPAWLTFGLGIFLGGLFVSWGLRTGLPRFYGLAVLAITTGLVLGWYSRGLNIVSGRDFLLTGPGIFFVVLGSGMCISGGITLRNYLQKTSPVREDQNDG